jgi:hypothetical protein
MGRNSDCLLPWVERFALAYWCGSASIQHLTGEQVIAILRVHIDPSSMPPRWRE